MNSGAVELQSESALFLFFEPFDLFFFFYLFVRMKYLFFPFLSSQAGQGWSRLPGRRELFLKKWGNRSDFLGKKISLKLPIMIDVYSTGFFQAMSIEDNRTSISN